MTRGFLWKKGSSFSQLSFRRLPSSSFHEFLLKRKKGQLVNWGFPNTKSFFKGHRPRVSLLSNLTCSRKEAKLSSDVRRSRCDLKCWNIVPLCLVQWWRPEQVWEGCGLRWQLCHDKVTTFTPYWSFCIVLLVFNFWTYRKSTSNITNQMGQTHFVKMTCDWFRQTLLKLNQLTRREHFYRNLNWLLIWKNNHYEWNNEYTSNMTRWIRAHCNFRISSINIKSRALQWLIS